MNNEIVKRLRLAHSDGKPATPLELEAAGVIESLEFQLAARIEKAPVTQP